MACSAIWRRCNRASCAASVSWTAPINDALVLITDEAPGAYWYVLPLYILLGLFVALFGWALVRGLMPERQPQRASKRAQSAA